MRRCFESNITRSLELGKIYGFIILSACRSDWDLDDKINNNRINKKKTKELMSDIQKCGLSYIQVYGGYVEKGLGEVTEDSFFILNYDVRTNSYYSDMDYLKDVGIDLCKKYNQDSFLFSPPYEKPYYVDKFGNEDDYKFGKIVFNAPTDEQNPYFISFKKGGGGYNRNNGKFGKSDSRFRYESKDDIAKKRLLPITMTYSDDNTWTLSSSEEGYGSYAIKTTPERMRKALLRMKFKNQDTHANSKRTVKYMDIVDDLMNKGNSTCYCWKSFYPKSREDFERLTND